ncbi:MAG: DNRLRE domain-containing protein [Thermoleophilia bacterium]
MKNPAKGFVGLTGARKYLALLIPSSVLFAALVVAAIAILCLRVERAQAYGETSAGLYNFGNGDVIEFCTTNRCSGAGNQDTVTFAPGSTVYVRVHTTRFSGGTGYLYLYNYFRNASPPGTGYVRRNLVWTQVGSDYYSSLLIPASQAYYMRLYGQIVSGSNQITFQNEIELTTQPARFMNYYWTGPQPYPPNAPDESYVFHSGATVNVMGYGVAANYSAAYTKNSIKDIDSGVSTPLTMAGYSRVSTNYHRFTLQLPASGLADGQWYSINSHIMRSSSALDFDMSRMVLIDDSPPVASIDSPSASAFVKGTVPVIGTADDAYSYYKYVLDYGAGASPSSWTTIASATNSPPVRNNLLGSWDTTGLTDGQLYTLRLTVTDRAGNPGNQTVVTRQVYVDNNPPAISGVGASQVRSGSASIGWTTDEVADSQVSYGTSPGSYTDTTTLDPSMVTSHSQGLTGLQPSTTYYYQVASTDRGGNTSVSAENSFTTANVTVIQLFPASGKDSYLGSGQPTWNHGAEATLSAGDLAASGMLRSAIDFDLSGFPTNATVCSATLSLFQMGQADANAQWLNVHYLKRDWSEGSGAGSATGDGSTWLTSDGVNSWPAGGDFNAAVSATSVGPNSTTSWVNWDITSLAQSWIETPAHGGIANYGAIIKQPVENPAVNDAKSFYSAECTADPTKRPKLVIEWFGSDTTPPAIGEVRAENVSRNTADIRWSTDTQADSQVEYGTTTSYGSTTTLDPASVNQHSLPLTGLTEDTVFHYRVKSTDSFGNTAVSGDYVFQTARLLVIQPAPVTGKDTSVSSTGATLNYGGSTDITAGNISASAETRRGLIKFDLSAIPVGSTVNSATLSIYQHGQQSSATVPLELDYATRTWAEGTGNGAATGDGATWVTSDGVNGWSAAGGDFNNVAPPTATAPDSPSGAWVDFAVRDLTQNWINGSITNEGAFIKKVAENPAANDARYFYSSDYLSDASLRPKLAIEYVPAPGSMTITVNETYNRDDTPGNGSVGFGNTSPGTSYDVGEAAPPAYAVRLTVKSNTRWGIEMAAAGDLAQLNPGNTIDISNLKWKKDGEAPGAFQATVKSPAKTVITNMQPAADDFEFLFDYRLSVPMLAVSGNYSTSIVYTAFPS